MSTDDTMTAPTAANHRPAVAGPVERGVGRPVPEREDHELLELAARAIGARVVCSVAEMHGCTDASTLYRGVMLYGVQEPWNPLHDDGDALRLAVKLRIDLLMDGPDICSPTIEAMCNRGAEFSPFAIEALDTGDPYAATRRSIVRAAAALASYETPNVEVTGAEP